MKNVLFLINSLGGGGAERVLVNLVNHMDHEKYDITVETLFGGGVNREQLDKSIHYIEHRLFNIPGVSYFFKLIPSVILARLFIRECSYDLCVAYIQGPATKVVSGKHDCKKIAWLHASNVQDFIGKSWLTKGMTINAYKKFELICGVSSEVIRNFSLYSNIAVPCAVVYNTNDTGRIRQKAREPYEFGDNDTDLRICTVGRLETVKGFDRLIKSAKKLHDEGYKFNLYILGEGSKQHELEKQIIEANGNDYIHMLGFCMNPYSIMAKCDFFICSSLREGLSTVLTESLILGLPIISTDVSGAKEVLGDNNEYGLVVENSDDGIYNGLKRFLKEPLLREKYKGKAMERSTAFETYNTVKSVEEILDSVIDGQEV